MAFAATLISLDDPESDHRDHARKAMSGARNDPLLAQNLGSNFNRQTILSYWPTRLQGGEQVNLPIEKDLSKTRVGFWLPRLFAFGLLAFGFADWLWAVLCMIV